MKKKNILSVLLFLISACVNAQGVKQLWTTTWEDLYPDAVGVIISFDSIGNHFQQRHEFPHPPATYPESLNFYNGKFYSIVSPTGVIYEYDPATSNSIEVGALEGNDITVPHRNAMTLVDGVFYGVSTHWTSDEEWNYLFEWNPTTRVFTRKYNFTGQTPSGAMVAKDGKMYGMTMSGTIFEWDPVTNEYATKINFPEEDKGSPTGSMVLLGDKFYGVCSGSGDIAFYGNPPEDSLLLTGALFEWDPATNDFNIKYDFDIREAGINPVGNLVEKDGKLYGITFQGGLNNAGVLFEFDPSATSNAYTKKADMDIIGGRGGKLLARSAGNLYGYRDRFLFEWNSASGQLTKKQDLYAGISDLLVVSASISSPSPGNCENYPSVLINSSNNNQWVPVTGSNGDVLAEIQPHGNNLGVTNAQVYINNGGIRSDGAGRPYLNRSITLTPTTQPSEGNPVDIRLYITKSEFDLLKASPQSGISDISDIAIFKSSEACSGGVVSASPIPTTYEDYAFGYVLKATITSFSTFYFSNRTFEALPLQMLAFTGTLKNDDVLLQWTTDHEYNTRDFDIERSTDGNHFILAGNVPAFNNEGMHKYNFTDKKVTALPSGILYYRLKQKDVDGKYEYSKTISVDLPVEKIFILSPNPAQNFLNILYRRQDAANNAILQITDMGGKKVLEQIINSAAVVNRINISMLSKGVYMVSILNNGERATGKFVKQ